MLLLFLLFLVGTHGFAELKIVQYVHDYNAPDLHEKCVRMCAGTTGRDTVFETSRCDAHPDKKFVKTTVDISECGFILRPVVSTTLNYKYVPSNSKKSNAKAALISGTAGIARVDAESFVVHLNGFNRDKDSRRDGLTTSWARDWLAINWSAMGYVC